VKLCDFGFAERVGSLDCKGAFGTPLFMAPEMRCKAAYGAKVDVWSFGIIVYILLFGRLPYGGTPRANANAIRSGRSVKSGVDFGSGVVSLRSAKLTSVALDFLQATLQRDPRERLAACDALAHDFFATQQQQCEGADDGGMCLRSALEEAQACLAVSLLDPVANSQLDAMLAVGQRLWHGPPRRRSGDARRDLEQSESSEVSVGARIPSPAKSRHTASLLSDVSTLSPSTNVARSYLPSPAGSVCSASSSAGLVGSASSDS